MESRHGQIQARARAQVVLAGRARRELLRLPERVQAAAQSAMSIEQRVRAYRRSARNSFYRQQAEYGNAPGVTNWRMLIAQRFRIPIAEVRRILGENNKRGQA